MHRKINNAYFALRWRVLNRDNFTCQYCGQFAPNVILHVDHIKSVEDGGTDDDSNLITSCSACNMGKSGLRIISTRTSQRQPKPYAPKEFTRTISTQATSVLGFLANYPSGTRIENIAQGLNLNRNNIRTMVCRLLKRNKVKRVSTGLYSLS